MSNLLVLLVVMVGVSYLIVVERKGLGMFQLRLGPNKVGWKGLVQPVADGVKLFTKQFSMPYSSILGVFLLGPALCMFLSYSVWVVLPSFFSIVRYPFGVLFVLCVSATHVFGTFLVGWSADSRYSFLGAMRGVAQTISYEVIFTGVVFCPLIWVGSYDLLDVRSASGMCLLFFCFESIIIWLIVVLAELNRTPFDFVEGESELVAGYTVEFGGAGFALIALAEYGNIYFMSMLTSVIFFSGASFYFLGLFANLITAFLTVFFSFLIIGIRGSMPRYRYDLLMIFCWEKLLPLMLISLGVCVGVVLSC